MVKARKGLGTHPRSCSSPLPESGLDPDPSIPPYSFHCTTVAFPQLSTFKKLKAQLIILMFVIIQRQVTDTFFWHYIDKTSSMSNLTWLTLLLSSILFISPVPPEKFTVYGIHRLRSSVRLPTPHSLVSCVAFTK